VEEMLEIGKDTLDLRFGYESIISSLSDMIHISKVVINLIRFPTALVI
jgi:hypothetical protein